MKDDINDVMTITVIDRRAGILDFENGAKGESGPTMSLVTDFESYLEWVDITPEFFGLAPKVHLMASATPFHLVSSANPSAQLTRDMAAQVRSEESASAVPPCPQDVDQLVRAMRGALTYVTDFGRFFLLELTKQRQNVYEREINDWLTDNPDASCSLSRCTDRYAYVVKYKPETTTGLFQESFEMSEELLETIVSHSQDRLKDVWNGFHGRSIAVTKQQPKNNDGRQTCFSCGAPTKTVEMFLSRAQVCTKCGK